MTKNCQIGGPKYVTYRINYFKESVDCNKLCGSCEFQLDPVCGSDGVSYPNECFFKCAKCKYNGEDMSIEHRGFCNKYPPIPTEPPIIRTTGFARSKGFESKICDEACKKLCPNKTSYVCGDNHVTYKNYCHLKCRPKFCNYSALGVKYRGKCRGINHEYPPEIFRRLG